MPKKYDPQTRAKAIRLVRDHVGDYASQYDAIRATASRLGMNPETLRKWIRQDEVDHGDRQGNSTYRVCLLIEASQPMIAPA